MLVIYYSSESTGRSSYHIDHTETCVSVAPTARGSVATGHTGSCVYDPNVIKICCWNVNGLTQTRLSKDLIGDYLSMFDLILLCETWAADDDDYELQGYTFYNYPRPFKQHNARRCSGGLGIFIRNSIINGVQILKLTKNMIVWIKIEKHFCWPRRRYLHCHCIFCTRRIDELDRRSIYNSIGRYRTTSRPMPNPSVWWL